MSEIDDERRRAEDEIKAVAERLLVGAREAREQAAIQASRAEAAPHWPALEAPWTLP